MDIQGEVGGKPDILSLISIVLAVLIKRCGSIGGCELMGLQPANNQIDLYESNLSSVVI